MTFILFVAQSLVAQAAELNNPDPSSVQARMSTAMRLAEDSFTAEEARDALSNLLAYPEYRTQARNLLAQLLMEEEARVGWNPDYHRLRMDTMLPPEIRDALSLKAGQAPAWNIKERRAAITLLKELRGDYPDTDQVDIALGHLYLLDAKPEEALKWFRKVVTPQAAAGEAYALMALNRMSEIVRLPSGGGSPTFQAAIANPTAANRARALFEGGYGLLARQLVGTPQDCVASGCFALAEIYQVLGDYNQEVITLQRVQGQIPNDPAILPELVEALLDKGDLTGARKAAGENAELLKMVEGVALVKKMDSRDPLVDQETMSARALELAPNRWEVRIARADVLVRQKKHAEAFDLLTSLTADHPTDPVVLWACVRAGVEAGKETEVLKIWHNALRRATNARRRAEISADLAIVYGIIGEYHKNTRGDLAMAQTSYQIGIAMNPGNADLYSGLGGILWKGRRFADARTAYLMAIQLEDDSEKKANNFAYAAMLSIELNDPDGAEALIAQAKGSTPELEDARRLVAYARIISAARALGKGERESSIRSLRRMSIDHAFNPAVLQAVGFSMLEQKFPQDALDTFRKALKVDVEIARYRGIPSTNQAWLKLGEILALIDLGDLDGAGIAYQTLQNMDTSLVEPEAIKTARIALLRGWGDQARKAGNYSSAAEFYRQVQQIDTHDGWSYIGMGEIALATHRPAAAYAYFTAAASDSMAEDNDRMYQARLGQLRALQAQGKLREAEQILDEAWNSGASGQEQEDLEMEIRLARFDQTLAAHDEINARRMMIQLRSRYPDQPAVRAADAQLSLYQEDYQSAYDLALRALRMDPTQARAAQVLYESSLHLEDIDLAADELAVAYELGGDLSVYYLANKATFDIQLQEVREDLHRGRWAQARDNLDEIWRDVRTEPQQELIPDRAASVAGLYLDMGLADSALTAFSRALEINRNHIPSIVGIAGVYRWQGDAKAAQSWLEGEWDRTHNTEVGLALIDVNSALNQPKKNESVLRVLDSGDASVPHEQDVTLIPLPDGNMPPTEVSRSIAHDEALRRRIQEERDAPMVPAPDAAIGTGIMHQSGTFGRTFMLGNVSIGSLQQLRLGPVSVFGDVLPVALTDNVVTEEGVAFDLGAGLSFSRFTLQGRIGSSPIGFLGGNYAIWSADAWYAGSPFAFGIGTAREPLTDSLASWAGKRDANANLLYGRTSWTWVGGWAELSFPNGMNGGLRLWTGALEGLNMQPVNRQMVTGWANRELASPTRELRIGLQGTWLRHDRQVDGFAAGQSGAFTPLGYAAAFVTADGRWNNATDIDLCGGANLGIEYVTGTDTDYMSVGAHPAVDLHGGMDYGFAPDWHFGAGAAWMGAGGNWNQELGMIWVRFQSDESSPTDMHIPGVFGQRPGYMGGCRTN